jgi:hypothetical protein
VIGDSIAADTYAWLRAAYPEYNIIQKTGPGCNLELAVGDAPKPCASVRNSALQIALGARKPDAVVLASLWNRATWATPRPTPPAIIDQLVAAGIKVVLVGPPAGFTVAAYDLIDKCPSSQGALTDEELTQCARSHSGVFKETNIGMKQYAREKGLVYIEISELACNDAECPILDEGGQLMYIEAWHRSLPGAVSIGRRARQGRLFEQILAK